MPAVKVGIQFLEAISIIFDHIRPPVMWERIDESFQLRE